MVVNLIPGAVTIPQVASGGTVPEVSLLKVTLDNGVC